MGDELKPVDVTQADRDLLEAIARPMATNAVEHRALDYCLNGKGDDAPALQTIARYRLAASPDSAVQEVVGAARAFCEANAEFKSEFAHERARKHIDAAIAMFAALEKLDAKPFEGKDK